jgi:chemotaxis response regulator CheB
LPAICILNRLRSLRFDKEQVDAGERYRGDRHVCRGRRSAAAALRRLPADFPAAIFVTQHLSPSARSVLPQLLDRAGPLPRCRPSTAGDRTRAHLCRRARSAHAAAEGRILMRRGPYENRTRPAVNALFRSAAIAYGAA